MQSIVPSRIAVNNREHLCSGIRSGVFDRFGDSLS